MLKQRIPPCEDNHSKKPLCLLSMNLLWNKRKACKCFARGESPSSKKLTGARTKTGDFTFRPGIDQESFKMKIKSSKRLISFSLLCLATMGCASQYGHILSKDDTDLVGSHTAGAATWNPLVDQAVAKLLGRCPSPIQPAGFTLTDQPESSQVGSALADGTATVCFVGIENKSAEEIGDFKDQLYERIDMQVNETDSFRGISRRLVDAALLETRLRPDSLFLPDNRDRFASALGRQGTPVDYLLYATITSGTTERNKTSQRDYLLTLELVNLKSGDAIKESAEIRKGYSNNVAAKWWHFGLINSH